MKAQFFPYHDENPTKTRSYVNYALIAINVAVFIWSLTDFSNIIRTWGFIPVQFSLVTLFTSMFLHGSIDHIFGNLWYLFIFGDNVEDQLGHARYLGFYLAAGVSAALIQFSTDPASVIPTIGASGAISGVLGAYLAMFPKVRVRAIGFYMSMNLSALWIIGSWFFLQLIWGVTSLVGGIGSNIAFWAHIGGFVFGYAAVKFLKK